MKETDRVLEIKTEDGRVVHRLIYSPADHRVIPFDGRWMFNGDLERPTFSPSMVDGGHGIQGRERTHFFLEDGKIRYLEGPGTGQVMECPALIDWPVDERAAWL